MTSIYDQHDAAFRNTSAYVVARNGERVATIAFKFPKEGAGRLYAYVHWIGLPMVRGFASGYGYDKRTGAMASAAKHMLQTPANDAQWQVELQGPEQAVAYESFLAAISADRGPTWESALRDAGFDVWQAV